MWVSASTRSAKPRSSEPPPASRMPWRTMSPASSGGVSSSVAWIAAMMSVSGDAIAPRTSWLVSWSLRGRPESRSRPRMSTSSSVVSVGGRADGELDRLRALRADRHHVLGADVRRDRLVEVVAADAHRARDDDLPERDDGDLARAAADVDHHAPDRLGDRDAGADGRRDRLLDQVDLARAGRPRRLLDRAALDLGDPGRRADDEARVRAAALEHLRDEVAEHLLGHLEVGDHAVAQRPRRRDRRGRAADHALGVGPDGVDLARALVDRDDGRLGQHDAAAAHVHDRVRGPQVDGHVADRTQRPRGRAAGRLAPFGGRPHRPTGWQSRARRPALARMSAMDWQIYLSGEIHTDWRERIAQGIADAGLDVDADGPGHRPRGERRLRRRDPRRRGAAVLEGPRRRGRERDPDADADRARGRRRRPLRRAVPPVERGVRRRLRGRARQAARHAPPRGARPRAQGGRPRRARRRARARAGRRGPALRARRTDCRRASEAGGAPSARGGRGARSPAAARRPR